MKQNPAPRITNLSMLTIAEIDYIIHDTCEIV